MTKLILGISAYYHDSAATLLRDGVIIAAAQEERFTRVKHDPRFPTRAIEYCLSEAQCQLSDLDAVIFYDKPLLKFERLLETYLANVPRGLASFIKAMPVWMKEKLYLKSVLKRELRQLGHIEKGQSLPKLLFSDHHLSHAGSAFFPSPFKDAAVLCLDGVGEWATSTAWRGEGNKLTPLWEIHFPHSLGLLYSAFTYYCGFKVNSGEYKLMGLAPYGEPKYVDIIKQHLISLHADGSFSLNMRYFDYATGDRMTNRHFAKLFGGAPHPMGSEPTQKQMDLARSIQVVTEEIVLNIVNELYRIAPSDNLCLAGGVALNCVANGRIAKEGPYKHVWVQPAAGDAGGSLGAAYVAWHHYYQAPRSPLATDSMQGSYLGPCYHDEDIVNCLEHAKLPYESLSDDTIYDWTAKQIGSGNVVGWYQGRMEFGPRALGNRSILGDPRNSDMQTVMNLKIKQRESFRPFAPAVLQEDVAHYFDFTGPSPYMLMVASVANGIQLPSNRQLTGLSRLTEPRSQLPAITHVDYSARIQTVNGVANPEFYALLKAFKAQTGCGVLINTSFNVRGEPPVESPNDAIRCFLATDMDYLVMNHVVLSKRDMPQAAIEHAKSITFAED